MELNLIFNTEKQILNVGDTISLETLQNSISGLFEQPLPEQFQIIYYLPNYEKKVITEQSELNQILQEAILNQTKQLYLFIQKPDVVIMEEDLYSEPSSPINNNIRNQEPFIIENIQQQQNQSQVPQVQELLIQSSKNIQSESQQYQQQEINFEEEKQIQKSEEQEQAQEEEEIKSVIRNQLSAQFEDIVDLIYLQVRKEMKNKKQQKCKPQQQQPQQQQQQSQCHQQEQQCGNQNDCEITIDLPSIIGRFLGFMQPPVQGSINTTTSSQAQQQANNQNPFQIFTNCCGGSGQQFQGQCQGLNSQQCENLMKCVGSFLNQMGSNGMNGQQQQGGCCSQSSSAQQQSCCQNQNNKNNNQNQQKSQPHPCFQQQQQQTYQQPQQQNNGFQPNLFQTLGPLIGQVLSQNFSQQQPQGGCNNFVNQQSHRNNQQHHHQQQQQQQQQTQQQQQQQPQQQFQQQQQQPFPLEGMLRGYCMKQGLNGKQIDDLIVRIKEFVGQNQDQLGEIIRNVCSGILSLDELLYNLQIKQ